MPPVLSIDAVRSAGRRLAAPFRLRVLHRGDAAELRCTEILRLLPSKRVVCVTEWAGESAIAKIFLDPWRSRRQARRELRGTQAFERAGIPTPRLLAACVSAEGRRPILVFQRIAPANDLGAMLDRRANDADRFELVKTAVQFIARQHDAGLFQRDLHFGNLLVCGGVFYAVDGAAVHVTSRGKPLSARRGVENLALFLAQFRPPIDEWLPAIYGIYMRARGLNDAHGLLGRLSRSVRVYHARRVRAMLLKATGNCTDIVRRRKGRSSIICRREYDSPAMRRILAAPDEAIAAGTPLKIGNSATVTLVPVPGGQVVIKRYCFDRLGKRLRYLFRASRARRAWLNAHLFQVLGVATAKPIALIERRYGPIKTAAYLVTQFVDGESGKHLFQRADLTDDEARAFAERTASMLGRMHDAGVSHGDLKATNLIYQGTDPVLIDLDGARRHRAAAARRGFQRRDRRRLLRNFTAPNLLHQYLAGRLRDAG